MITKWYARKAYTGFGVVRNKSEKSANLTELASLLQVLCWELSDKSV